MRQLFVVKSGAVIAPKTKAAFVLLESLNLMI